MAPTTAATVTNTVSESNAALAAAQHSVANPIPVAPKDPHPHNPLHPHGSRHDAHDAHALGLGTPEHRRSLTSNHEVNGHAATPASKTAPSIASVSSPKSHTGDRAGSSTIPHSEMNDQGVPTNQLKPNAAANMPITLIPVIFKEASLDSPSFRATVNHVISQLAVTSQWLEGFVQSVHDVTAEMHTLQAVINNLVGKFMPSFVTEGVVDHDYTMLVLRRFAEGSKLFWTNAMKNINGQNTHLGEPLVKLLKQRIAPFSETVKAFRAAQTKYDAAQAKYLALNKTREPSHLRDEAMAVYEARATYIKASFEFCAGYLRLHHAIDRALILTITDTWRSNARNHDDSAHQHAGSAYFRLGIEMHRIRNWSNAIHQANKVIVREIGKARKEIEDSTLAAAKPSKDIAEYQPLSPSTKLSVDSKVTNHPIEKHGWLLMKTNSPAEKNPIWVRRWAFVKAGLFGWLNVSPPPECDFVEESDKIGVLLCSIKQLPTEERRFCFEIKTQEVTLIVQAESLTEFKSWLVAFELAKQQSLDKESPYRSSLAFKKWTVPLPEFASSGGTSIDVAMAHTSSKTTDTTSPSYLGGPHAYASEHHVHQTPLHKLMASGKAFIDGNETNEHGEKSAFNFSGFGPFNTSLAPSPPIITPIYTRMTKEAIVSTAFVKPSYMPNAVTANVWGSVNWALYAKNSTVAIASHENMVEFQRKMDENPTTETDPFPENYPIELKSQDLQMRAIFQTAVDHDPNDRVVTVFRCLWSPNPRQELPGRVFVTLKNLYVYSYSLGFVCAVKKPLTEIVSVQGSPDNAWENLYVLGTDGAVLRCRVFLDSGRLVQRRLQIILSNVLSDSPRNLEEMLPILQDGDSDHKILTENDGWYERESDLGYIDNVQGEHDEKFSQEELSEHLVKQYRDLRNKRKEVKATKRPTSSSARSVASKTVDTPDYSLHSSTAQKVVDREFLCPPKALFHIMFGQKSRMFKDIYSRFHKVISSRRTRWMLNPEDKTLSRLITYDLKLRSLMETGTLVSRNLQVIERMDENVCYVVHNSRNPWEISHVSSFYQSMRFVITANDTGGSRLCIWDDLVYTEKKRSLFKSVVETVAMRYMEHEAESHVRLIQQCLRRVGTFDSTNRSIIMYGKLGQIDTDPTPEQLAELERKDSQDVLKVSRRRLVTWVSESIFTFLLTALTAFMIIIVKLAKGFFKSLSPHIVLIVLLAVSGVSNLWLSGRLTYFHIKQHQEARRAAPSDTLYRAVFINDLDPMMLPSDTNNTDSIALQKYLSLEKSRVFGMDPDKILKGDDGIGLEDKFFENKYFSDVASRSASRKIQKARYMLGIKRRELLVNLRVLNRSDRDLAIEEWQNWLRSEVRNCERFTARVAADPLYGKDKLDEGKFEQIENYCNSCRAEIKVPALL